VESHSKVEQLSPTKRESSLPVHVGSECSKKAIIGLWPGRDGNRALSRYSVTQEFEKETHPRPRRINHDGEEQPVEVKIGECNRQSSQIFASEGRE
jgi:hypothetical protein